MQLFSSVEDGNHMTEKSKMMSGSSTPSPALASLLTPENCLSSTRIRAFLRLSRIATDDSIRQHLNEIDPAKCDEYFAHNIVPQWEARSNAILYCSNYAKNLRTKANSIETTTGSDYDLRIDPYALRNAHEHIENEYSRCVSIENWVANENNIESIIREQTSRVFSDKCYYKDWLQEFKVTSQNSDVM